MTFDDPYSQILDGYGMPGDWAVISLVDAEGAGADVAFTDGLAEFGHPELVLWARPTTGPDPGADWLLTHEDRMSALSLWARDLISGDLLPGDRREDSFDDGHARASFQFTDPVTAGVAGLTELPPGRLVIVVSWSLSRSPVAAAVDPAAPGVRRVARWTTRAEQLTAAWRRAGGPRVSAPLTSTPSRFGPMTHWVDARIDQVLAAGAPVLARFLRRVPLAQGVRCELCLQDRMTALACRFGRGGPAREVRNAAELTMMALIDLPGPIQALAEDAMGDPWQSVHESIESLLLAAVVADLAPATMISSASGAWEWAVQGGRVPGREWLAPAGARRAVQRLLTGARGESLLIPALSSGRTGLDAQASAWVTGLQTVAAGSARPGWLLTPQQRRPLSRAQIRHAEAVAAPLLTAMALPDWVDHHTWLQLTEPVRAHVPGLPRKPGLSNLADLLDLPPVSHVGKGHQGAAGGADLHDGVT